MRENYAQALADIAIALALPALAVAAELATGDGSLGVTGANGTIVVQGHGVIYGHFDPGRCSCSSYKPDDGDLRPGGLEREDQADARGTGAFTGTRRPLPAPVRALHDRADRVGHRRLGGRQGDDRRAPGSARPTTARSRSTAASRAARGRRARRSDSLRRKARREWQWPPSIPTILVVEDESSIASFVSLYLKNAGYAVKTAATGADALAQVAAHSPALIVLDLMLPDIDGIEVCKRIRQSSDVPILMLTARDEDVDKIIGLEVGADDYLTKPFNPRELVARIKSILRRASPERRELETEVIAHGDLRVDAGRREAHVGGEEIQLAPKEFDLLWELLDHRGLVLTRDQLLERVWGYTFAGDTRTVDVHVRQLRRKLGDASPIVTVWGVGYKVSTARETAEGRRAASRHAPGPCSRRSASGCRSSSSAGIVLAGLVTTLIAVQLFRDFARDQTLNELRREADGIAQLYSSAVTGRLRRADAGESRRAPTFARRELEQRDRRPDLLRRAGRSRFPARSPGCRSSNLHRRSTGRRARR